MNRGSGPDAQIAASDLDPRVVELLSIAHCLYDNTMESEYVESLRADLDEIEAKLSADQGHDAAKRQEFVALNTDREIWRKGDGDGNGMSYYEPSIHVTQQGDIGINVGGTVFEKPVEEWHRLAKDELRSPRLKGFRIRRLLIGRISDA